MVADWLTDESADNWLEAPGMELVSEEPTVPAEIDAPIVPQDVGTRNGAIAKAWAALSRQQRYFLEVFEEHNFNCSKALRKIGPMAPSRSQVTRWKRDEDFAFILAIRKAANAAEALQKNEIILSAVDIREEALKPKPILYQGAPTGYEENQPDVALRANEQLAKIAGVMRGDDAPSGAQGPALVIQVVQRSGDVIDVTPRGVTIDLPAPDGD